MNVQLKQMFGSDEAASVVLVSSRPELHARLQTAFMDTRFKFAGIESSLSEAGPQFGARLQPTILIADLQGDLGEAIVAIERVRQSGFTGAIITVSESLDEASVRGLLRLHVTDWLPIDADAEVIFQACQRASSARRRLDRETKATCISFVPAAGGVGTTTLAIQTAFLLARRSRNFEATCLFDLNFHSGTLADYLDLKPVLDMGAIANQPERLDARLLEVMIARHPTGMAVMAAPRAATEYLRVNGAVISGILNAVSAAFEQVVIDMPPLWQPWTFDVLQGCDQVLITTEFTIPAMRKALELVRALEARFKNESPQVGVIVNKFEHKLFGGGLRKGDATALLGEALVAFVPDERELINEAINQGDLASAVKKSSRVSRELTRLMFKE
jgi:pilus assembly protein CpaE